MIFPLGGNLRSSRLRMAIPARKFTLRQGLWTEDLRIPPGQECSNGSLILRAVVLWRELFISRAGTALDQAKADTSPVHDYETR